METINLPYGPWTKIFTGTMREHEIALFQNPKRDILFTVFDMKEEKKVGAVIVISKVYVFSGDLSLFFQNISVPSVVIRKKNARYLIISSEPFYVSFSSGTLVRDIKSNYLGFLKSNEVIKADAPAYKVSLRDLASMDASYTTALLEEPVFLPALLSRAKETAPEPGTGRETVKTLSLGTNIKGEEEFLSFDSVRSSFLAGRDEETRLKFVQLLAEECIINGIQPVIFDYGRHFRGIAKPASEHSKTVEPIGFSSDFFETGVGSYVDVSLLPGDVLAEVFGLGTDPVSEAVVEKIKEAKDMQRAYDLLDKKKNDYETAKASRILKLLIRYYSDKIGFSLRPDLFLPKEKARAVVLEISNVSDEVRGGIIASVMNAILPNLDEKNPVKPFFIFLRSDNILTQNTAISQEFDRLFEETLGKGIFMLISADSDEFISDKIFNVSESKIYISERDEVVIKQTHSPPARVKLRPLHSLAQK